MPKQRRSNAKLGRIREAIGRSDLNSMAMLAVTEGGLVNMAMRSIVWPALLGIQHVRFSKDPAARSSSVILKEFDMDIRRSMFQLSCCKNISNGLRMKRRKKLATIMCDVLQSDPSLYYFQGFHDICTIHLLGLDNEQVARNVAVQMSKMYLKDHHGADFKTTIQVIKLVPLIIKRFDTRVYQVLEEAQVTNGIFALSWIITGFAHTIDQIEVVLLLFDAMFANHPAFILYICAAFILRPSSRSGLLQLEDKSMPMVHHYLQNIPAPCLSSKPYKHNRIATEKQVLNTENEISKLILSARVMMQDFPPEDLLCLAPFVPKSSVVRFPSDLFGHWFHCQVNADPGMRRRRTRKSMALIFAAISFTGMLSASLFTYWTNK